MHIMLVENHVFIIWAFSPTPCFSIPGIKHTDRRQIKECCLQVLPIFYDKVSPYNPDTNCAKGTSKYLIDSTVFLMLPKHCHNQNKEGKICVSSYS